MRKRRADRDNSNPGFFFVNKTQDSKSLSKSDGAVAKQINRHAQHFRTRKVEAQKVTSALTSSSSARRIALDGWARREGAPGSSSEESSPTSPHEQSTAVASTPTRPTVERHASAPVAVVSTPAPTAPAPQPSSLAASTNVWDILDEDDRRQDDTALELELPGPIYRANFTAYDCVDPFMSTGVQITSRIHTVLQYTLRIYPYSGNNYKLAFLPPHVRSTITQFPIRAIVQRSVYKEHHLYALMAAMTARMKHVFAVSPIEDDPEDIRAAAVYYLRKELIRCSRVGTVDKQTILDILYLAVNELQYGLNDEVRKHLLLVGKLYHLLDLNEHLDRWISETAAHVDNQLALTTARRPVLPYTFDPGPMLPERMATLRREARNLRFHRYPSPIKMVIPSGPKGSLGLTDIMSDLAETLDLRMGSQLSHALTVGAFPGRLGPIVADLVDCIEIAKVVWLSPLAVCFDAEWLCRKARAVLRALLALAPENTVGPKDLATKCLECARICFMVLLTYACTLIGPQTAKLNVKRHYKAKVTALEHWCPAIGWSEECVPMDPSKRLDALSETQAGFVLWSLFTGVWSSNGLPEEEWFMVRAANMCGYFGYSTYDDLHNHMAQYVYSRSLQERALRKVAARLQKTSTSWPGPVA